MVSSPASALMKSAPLVPTSISSPAVAAATAWAASAAVGAENTASGTPSPSMNLPTARSLRPSSSKAGVGVNVGPTIGSPVTGSATGAQSPAPSVASNSQANVKAEIGGTPSASITPATLRTENVSPTLAPGAPISGAIVILQQAGSGRIADGRIEEDVAIRKAENFKVANLVDAVGVAQASAAADNHRRMSDRNEAIAIAIADCTAGGDRFNRVVRANVREHRDIAVMQGVTVSNVGRVGENFTHGLKLAGINQSSTHQFG